MKNRVMEWSQQSRLCKQVVGLAMKVHRGLGAGFAETVYRNALAVELRKAQLEFELHPILSVRYEGIEVGSFQADLIINHELIVELKAVEALHSVHSTQLVNYLSATKIDHGVLINFGAPSLEFRTKSRIYAKQELPPPDLQI